MKIVDSWGMGNGKCSERIVPHSMTGPVLEGPWDFEEEVVGAYLDAQRLQYTLGCRSTSSRSRMLPRSLAGVGTTLFLIKLLSTVLEKVSIRGCASVYAHGAEVSIASQQSIYCCLCRHTSRFTLPHGSRWRAMQGMFRSPLSYIS